MTPTSVFILQASDRGAPDLAADFGAAGFTVRGSADCAHLVRDTLRAAPDGTLVARPTGAQGSHILSSLLAADALAMIPAGDGPLEAGAVVALEALVR